MERSFDDLVQAHQAGEIGWEDFVTSGPLCDDYEAWLSESGRERGDLSAKRFVECYERELVETEAV